MSSEQMRNNHKENDNVKNHGNFFFFFKLRRNSAKWNVCSILLREANRPYTLCYTIWREKNEEAAAIRLFGHYIWRFSFFLFFSNQSCREKTHARFAASDDNPRYRSIDRAHAFGRATSPPPVTWCSLMINETNSKI